MRVSSQWLTLGCTLLGLCVVVLTGCDRWKTNMQLTAANSLNCPHERVRVSYHSGDLGAVARGCGRITFFVWKQYRNNYVPITRVEHRLRSYASRYMECGYGTLRVRFLSRYEYELVGCGSRERYRYNTSSRQWFRYFRRVHYGTRPALASPPAGN